MDVTLATGKVQHPGRLLRSKRILSVGYFNLLISHLNKCQSKRSVEKSRVASHSQKQRSTYLRITQLMKSSQQTHQIFKKQKTKTNKSKLSHITFAFRRGHCFPLQYISNKSLILRSSFGPANSIYQLSSTLEISIQPNAPQYKSQSHLSKRSHP